jgi:hypothetical protein
MKKLWTSYYGNSRRLPGDCLKVQASNTAPHWWQPVRRGFEPDLAPEWMRMAWAKQVEVDDPAWVAHYTAQLQSLLDSGRLAEIVGRLPENAVLFCHEADWTICHRKVLAEFLTSHGLAEVTEFRVKTKSAKPQAQLSLF